MHKARADERADCASPALQRRRPHRRSETQPWPWPFFSSPSARAPMPLSAGGGVVIVSRVLISLSPSLAGDVQEPQGCSFAGCQRGGGGGGGAAPMVSSFRRLSFSFSLSVSHFGCDLCRERTRASQLPPPAQLCVCASPSPPSPPLPASAPSWCDGRISNHAERNKHILPTRAIAAAAIIAAAASRPTLPYLPSRSPPLRCNLRPRAVFPWRRSGVGLSASGVAWQLAAAGGARTRGASRGG